MVGLGNPGPKYEGTRHNVGFEVVSELAEKWDFGRIREKHGGLFGEGRAGPGGPKVILFQPLTFMNEAGRAAGPLRGSKRIPLERVIAVHDEIDLPFGEVRGKAGGGHGGHNGLRSIAQSLGGPGFLRVRIGVGRPGPGFHGDEADWVLRPFDEPGDQVDALLARGLEMTEAVLADGMAAAIARFHAKPPGERAKARAERRAEARQEGDSHHDPGDSHQNPGDSHPPEPS